MNTLAKLVKKRKLVQLCRIGCGVIAILGVAQIVLQSYTLWQAYAQTRGELYQGPAVYSPLSTLVFSYIPSMLESSLLYLFYGILLYCASVVFDAFSTKATDGQPANQPVEEALAEDDIVYTSLKPEEVLQSKKTLESR